MARNRYRLPGDVKINRLGSIRALKERIDWSHAFLGTDALTNRGTVQGKPLRICVLDTGCDPWHPDLKDAIVAAKDFTRSTSGVSDLNGHGTWCAGFIGARANSIGVRGIVPECELLIGKVLGDNGSGDERGIAAGIEWGYSQGADLFSLSLGGPRMSESLYRLIRELEKHGKLLFAAAGNDAGPVNFPAAWAEVIAVGAVDRKGRLTDFTSRGPELDILAPGFEMESLAPGGGYATMSGTSMATPCAVAVSAAVIGACEDAGQVSLRSAAALTNKLQAQGTTVGKYKLINPRNLVQDIAANEPESRLGPVPIGGYDVSLVWKKRATKVG